MASHSILQDVSDAIAKAAASAAPGIVEIASRCSLSSGFFWREGLVVTAEEALGEDGAIAVELSGGSQHAAELLGRDPSTDVALIKVEGVSVAPVVLNPDVPRPGSLTVVAAAAESAPLVAAGGIAAIGPAWRSMRGGKIDARIELDLRLRRRAEGGLALDPSGRAYGMAVRGPRGRTLVIPAATIERSAQLLLAHGRVPRGYLGLGLKEVALTDGGRGLMVMSVDPKGPAAEAGIVQGDVVVAWNDRAVAHLSALLRELDHEAIGIPLKLRLRRAGGDIDATLTIGARPRE